MQADEADIIEQAIAWHLRLPDARIDDWDAFTLWLEADPAHADAYDRIAAADRLVTAGRFPTRADNDNAPVAGGHRWRWAVGGMATAAAVALAVVAPSLRPAADDRYVVATRAGEQRTVALADGTRIELAGGSRLRLDRGDARVASLDAGEAVFHVRHDAARPFSLDASGIAIRDLGTTFDVATSGTRLAVAVAEGAVMFRPDQEALTLRAGDALQLDRKAGRVVRGRVEPALVGGWRQGTLSFSGESLGEVAARLNQLYDLNLALEGGLSTRPFTGMVRLTGAADRDVPHLAELIGATWRRDGKRWILSGGASAAR